MMPSNAQVFCSKLKKKMEEQAFGNASKTQRVLWRVLKNREHQLPNCRRYIIVRARDRQTR